MYKLGDVVGDKQTTGGTIPTFAFTLNLSKAGALSLFAVWLTFSIIYFLSPSLKPPPIIAATHQTPFSHLAHHCASSPPINKSEFHHRQAALVEVLRDLNASAYIAEPGASAKYYGNISASEWKLSERPLLLIIAPENEGTTAKISILTPKFEATRARNLPIPSQVQYIEWPEEADPYSFVIPAILDTTGSIFVDRSTRKFIVDGLQQALPNATIITAPMQVTQLRERKSKAEIDLLKCANEATLLAIREVYKRLYIGIHESEAYAMMASALSAAGLRDGGCLTLFGANAALPHGSGTNGALNKSAFVLFDCTASLHGYYSDVTRTIALPDSTISEEHLHIWNHVHLAQSIALRTAHAGVLAREVDNASRSLLDIAGYGSYFTHRLGHGIGLEVHEDPYLHGGSNTVIKSGHTFSDEPGIYIEGEVGVRLEDCFYINEVGNPVLLTEGAGGQSKSPWSP